MQLKEKTARAFGRDILLGVALALCLINAASCMLAFQKAEKLAASLAEHEVTREDGVVIANTYRILSTKAISDAYRSGDDSGLDESGRQTLTLATAVLDQIITPDMTPYEKERAVYDWLCENVEKDRYAVLAIPKDGERDDNPLAVLSRRKGVCAGFATTFRLMMQLMNIECMVVHDTMMEHSWNLVCLDGDWYHVDAYTDAGAGNYRNFNVTDEHFGDSYTEWDTDFFPAANGVKYNYACLNSQEISDYYAIPANVKAAIDAGQGTLLYRFNGLHEQDYAAIEYMLEAAYSYAIEPFEDGDEYGGYGGYGGKGGYGYDREALYEMLTWNWLEPSPSESVLAIYVNIPDNGGEAPSPLDARKMELAQEAIIAAFGEDYEEEEYARSYEEPYEESNDESNGESNDESNGESNGESNDESNGESNGESNKEPYETMEGSEGIHL